MINPYKIFVGEPKKKRSLEKPRHRWNNVKMDIEETGYEFKCSHPKSD
jgi:hypothetical protein